MRTRSVRSLPMFGCALTLLFACGGGCRKGADAGAGKSSVGSTPASSGRTTEGNRRSSSAPGGQGGGAACKGIPSPATTATGSGAKVALTIKLADTGCKVAPDFAGTNYEAFPGWGADVSMSEFQKQAFSAAGMQLLRFPGGEPGNWTDLLMTGKCKDGSHANWGAPSVAALWDFAKSAGVYSLMLQTNPTDQWCGADGGHDGSGAHAAEVAKAAAAKGVRAIFEVGNEPDIAGTWFAKNGGRDAYIAKFIEHARAIHSAVPGAEVYGPVVCGLGANCSFPTSWDSGWIDAFLARTGDKASGNGKGTVDGVSFHVYWHNEWSFSDFEAAKIGKYGFALYWANTVMPYVRALIAKHDSRDLPIAITEISIGNGVAKDGGQKQNMFSVLATLDTVAAFAASGLRSFQWFDANAEGPADFWMITRDAPRPTFYAFAAWAKMGDHVLELRSDTNPVDVAAYATKKSDGSLQVLIINKTSSEHEVTLRFEGLDPKGKNMAVHRGVPGGGGGESATSVTFNGQTNPAPSALPHPAKSTLAESAPKIAVGAYSFAVVEIGK
jgi:hypothetical protein